MGYKEDKEAFVSGQAGGALHRINAVSLVATSYALWTVAHHRLLAHLPPSDPRIPLVEFALLVVPLLLALTILSAHPYLLNLLLGGAALGWAYLPSRTPTSPPLSPSLSRSKPTLPDAPQKGPQRPFAPRFVTSYRAIMMVLTVLCILAVDFRAFPREFAKAETWGTSLMDLGVGSFVFSLGLTGALPLLRAPANAPPLSPRGYARALARSVRKCAPLVALGLVRVAMVKGVEYPVRPPSPLRPLPFEAG
ncbi:Glucosaminyl phosphatidylinositol (GlcN-PI) nositol acylation protein [Rhodotorula kratochvilovae]